MAKQDPYTKQLKDFLNMLQGRLSNAFDEQDKGNNAPMEKLYNQTFYLSFMGKTCSLDFGASEFQAIESMLQELLEELE